MLWFYLGFRYAKSRFANYVAVAAIALAVLVQIVVMAVLDGVLDDIKRRIQGLGEQITVDLPAGGASQEVYEKVAQAIREVPGVRGVTPGLQLYGLASGGAFSHPVMIRGIDLAGEMASGQMGQMLLDETRPAWPLQDGQPTGVLVGAQLAESLGVGEPGTQMTLEYASRASDELVRRTLPAVSRFRSGLSYFDEHVVFIPLSLAQEMAVPGGEKSVRSVSVWLTDPYAAGELRPAVRAATEMVLRQYGDFTPVVRTWQETFGSWFQAIQHENMLQQVVMAFISLSGAFCIFAILFTLVSGRIRDIGIIRSIGGSRTDVMAVFLLAGFLMGVIGAAIGTAGGIYVAPRVDDGWLWLTGEPLYPPYLFGVTELPVLIDGVKVAAYAVSAVIVATVASLPAAWYAARRAPLEALRHE